MKNLKNKFIYRVLASVLSIALVVTLIPVAYTKALAGSGMINIAADATIEAETPDWVMDWMKYPMLVDGNKNDGFYTSAFATDENTTKTILFSYGERAAYVEKIVLYPHIENDISYGFPKTYHVTVWDGEKWIEVKRSSGNTSITAPVEIAVDKTCNSIKITADVLGPSDNQNEPYCLQFAEIEVMGEYKESSLLPPDNVAPEAVAFGEIPSWVTGNLWMYPDVMNDKKIEPGWFYTSEYVDSQDIEKYVEFTFESAHNIEGIVLYPRVQDTYNGFPQKFKVEISNDSGETWKEVAAGEAVQDENGHVGKPAKVTFAVETGNKIRITATKLGNADSASQYALQLSEVAIIGEKAKNDVPDIPDIPDVPDVPEKPATENVAPKATIKAETPGWVMDWMKSPMLVDGNKQDGFYTSEHSTNQNEIKVIQFNYEKSYKFDRVVLYPAIDNGKKSAFPVDFSVSVWNGSEWVTVADLQNVTVTDSYEIKFASVEGNAVCLMVTKLGETAEGKFALMLAEAEIYGKETETVLNPAEDVKVPNVPDNPDQGTAVGNVAPNATIEAETPGWVMDWMKSPMLVDGNTNEGFYTSEFMKSQSASKIIQFNFKEAYKFDRVVLYPARDNGKMAGFPVDFSISVWNGSNWVVVANVKNAKLSDPYEIKFGAIEGNAVRLTATKLGATTQAGQYALMLGEMKIFGAQTGNQLPAAPSAGIGNGVSGGSSVASDSKGLFNSSKNVAYGCPVSVSSEFAQYGCVKENLTDGKADTFWATNGQKYKSGKEEFAEVNLLENYKINKIILLARQEGWGFPIDFTVSIFYDGKWKEVVSEKNYKIDESKKEVLAYEFAIPETIGNKVRITSKNYRDAGVDKIFCLNEVVVYGTSYADGVIPNDNLVLINSKVSTSTSIEDYAYYRQNLNDGDYQSEWSTITTSNSTEENWLEVKLIREFPVSEIQMKPAWGGNGFPLNFSIQVCEKGKWVTVYSAENYKKPVDEAIQRFQFEQKKITSFRIVTNKMERFGGLYSVKLGEVMAYREPVGNDFDLDAVKGGDYDQKYVATTYKDVLYDKNGNIVDAEGNILIPASFLNSRSKLLIVFLVIVIVAVFGALGAIFWIKRSKKRQNQQNTERKG